MIRAHAELGIEARWKADGTAVLIHPSGEEVPLVRDQGLHVWEWDQFRPLRSQLIESHQGGRQKKHIMFHDSLNMPSDPL